jgi:hypothetical protein
VIVAACSALDTRFAVIFSCKKVRGSYTVPKSEFKEIAMTEDKSKDQRTLSPELFARVIEKAVAPGFFTEDRLALMRQISQKLAQDPSLLKNLERMLGDYGQDLSQLAPKESEFASFGWKRVEGEEPMIVPVAAAAALAPAAAALAAGPCHSENG